MPTNIPHNRKGQAALILVIELLETLLGCHALRGDKD